MSQKCLVWADGAIINDNEKKASYFNQGLNYGACVYDGIRVYPTANGPAVFRLNDHLDRFFYSAKALRMNLRYDKPALKMAILELIKANGLQSGYVRPLAYYSEPKMGINILNGQVALMIICWDWDESTKAEPVTVKISKYERLSPKSVDLKAKIAGYYSGGLLSFIEAQEAGYDLPLMLDKNGNITEGAVNNFFAVKSGQLFTPQAGNILNGITRDTILKITPDLGIEVHETDMIPSFLKSAQEAFLSGTGIELLKIKNIEDIFEAKSDKVTNKVLKYLKRVTHGQVDKYRGWLTYVD